jgi:hypothetical protein
MMPMKKQFHKTLSFVDAIFDKKYLNEFIFRTGLHLTFGEKKVMQKEVYELWVEEWRKKYETEKDQH